MILCDLEVRKAKVFEGWTCVTVGCYQLICINLHIKTKWTDKYNVVQIKIDGHLTNNNYHPVILTSQRRIIPTKQMHLCSMLTFSEEPDFNYESTETFSSSSHELKQARSSINNVKANQKKGNGFLRSSACQILVLAVLLISPGTTDVTQRGATSSPSLLLLLLLLRPGLGDQWQSARKCQHLVVHDAVDISSCFFWRIHSELLDVTVIYLAYNGFPACRGHLVQRSAFFDPGKCPRMGKGVTQRCVCDFRPKWETLLVSDAICWYISALSKASVCKNTEAAVLLLLLVPKKPCSRFWRKRMLAVILNLWELEKRQTFVRKRWKMQPVSRELCQPRWEPVCKSPPTSELMFISVSACWATRNVSSCLATEEPRERLFFFIGLTRIYILIESRYLSQAALAG